ncbi:G-protein gamma-like domain [Trinorchestia longiramus]|nr:G-protein gamma-like domain [Trinorchestia longiramus]
MEALVREMQDPETGIPIRSQKLFLTTIPSAFMGYELVEWLMERLDIEDSTEAIHLANLLCQFGYFFPVGEARSLIVKEDSSLYRFQSPYYWPSQNHCADTTDYAIYLTKRLFRNKQKHGLEDFELEIYNKMKRGLQHKWDFVTMQAEEQMRLSKERKKGDKIVTDSQERAYWRVYRPPQGFTNCLEVAPVPDKANMANRVRKKTAELLNQELEWLRRGLDRTRSKVSVASEALISHCEVFMEYDAFLVPPHPSNPWISDEEEFWMLNDDYADVPTERRVKRWAINFQELISDALGMSEFTNYLRKEYSHENIRFWQAVNELRYGPASGMNDAVESIYEEFLKPGAPCEINIDGKTMEETQQQRKQPSRYTYDLASEHVYALLLKKDCYPRYLRSEDYKNLLATAVQPSTKKARFFHLKSGAGRKKASTSASASNSLALVAVTPQPLKRHGSDEHQQARVDAGGVHLGSTPTPPLSLHKLDCDPPYRGDLPTQRILTQSKDVSGAYAAGEAQEALQSSVCPWETAEASNICPWENSELPSVSASRTPTTQPSSLQLQQQKSFRVESSTTHLKGKPPDRSVSVDVCSMSQNRGNLIGFTAQVSPTSGPLLAPSAGDSKVTLNICPWESQDLPQKQEKSRSVDVDVCPWDQSTDDSKQSTESPLIGGREQSGDKSPSSITTTDSKGEIVSEASIKQKEIEKMPGTSPSRSLQNLQQLAVTSSSTDASLKQQAYRLSTDLTNVKISVDQSGENSTRKSSHRELSASASVPCTSILGHQANLDYTVRSGHASDQYELKPEDVVSQIATTPEMGSVNISGVTSSTATTEEARSGGVQISDEKQQYPKSVPSTPQVRKNQTPRTVSVSSQTQTDPIVQRKTNQQTQYPSRDSSFRHSSRHSHRQPKHGTVHYAMDYPPTSRSQAQQMGMKHSIDRSQQFQIQLASLRLDTELEKQSRDTQQCQQDVPVMRKHSEPNQSKYSQQHRQQQYYHSKEDYDDHQRLQQWHMRVQQPVSLGNHRKEDQKSGESRSELQRFDEIMANQRRAEHKRELEMKHREQQSTLEEQLRQRERQEQHLARQHEIQLKLEAPTSQVYLQPAHQERQLSLQHYGDIRHEEIPTHRERMREFAEEEKQRSMLRNQLRSYESDRTSEPEPYSSIPSFPAASQETFISTRNQPHIVQTSSTHIQPQMSSSQVHHHQTCPSSYSAVYASSALPPMHDSTRDLRPTMTVVSTSHSVSPALPRKTASLAVCRESLAPSYSQATQSSHLAGMSGQIQIETSSGRIQIATSVSQKLPSRSSEEPTSQPSSSPKSTRPASKVWNDPADICPWEDEFIAGVDAVLVTRSFAAPLPQLGCKEKLVRSRGSAAEWMHHLSRRTQHLVTCDATFQKINTIFS